MLKHVQERADRDSTGSLVSVLGRGSGMTLTLEKLREAYRGCLNDCLLTYVAVTHDVFMYAMNPWLFGREFAMQWDTATGEGVAAGAGAGVGAGLGTRDKAALSKLSLGEFDLERAVRQMARWRDAVCSLYGLKRAVVVDGLQTVQAPLKAEVCLHKLITEGCRSDAAIMDVLYQNADLYRSLVPKSCAINCSLYFVARVPSVLAANPALGEAFGMGSMPPATKCPHTAMLFDHASVPLVPL